jgi:hypothetical protein
MALQTVTEGQRGICHPCGIRKNHILDGRRKHTVTASSVDDAVETVANFEKYLLPDTARATEQAVPSSGLRLR